MYRVVVVDDEYIVVEGIRALLRRIGADAEVAGTAQDGRSALSLIRELRPELVITDIRIPYMDGLSLIESCRELLPDTQYIVISGYQEFEYARTALRLGALDYIDKPITQDKLSAAFRRLRALECGRASDAGDGREEVWNPSAGRSAAREDAGVMGVLPCAAGCGTDVARSAEAERGHGSHAAVERVLAFIGEHYDRDIGLLELSELVGMNPAYLSVLFKEKVGISFIKYLTRVRVEKAKLLLAQGMKASEAGTAVGYNDPHYFYEIFKKNTGMTPGEYKAGGRHHE